MAKGSRGGKRGSGGGNNKSVNLEPVFDMNSVESKLQNKKEGEFVKSEVPVLVRNNEGGGFEVQQRKGYATMVDGVPVFIQKDSNGYSYNIYGMNATMDKPMKTLTEAKDVGKISKIVDRVKTAYNDINQVKDIFNSANKKGGITAAEYKEIIKKHRNKKTYGG